MALSFSRKRWDAQVEELVHTRTSVNGKYEWPLGTAIQSETAHTSTGERKILWTQRSKHTYRAVSAVKVARYLQCGMETLPPRSPTCSISKMFMKLQRVYLDCQSTYAEVTQAVAHTVVAPVRIALTP